MSVLKVIEVLGSFTISFGDAVKNAINAASKTVKNIKSVYVKYTQVTVNDNQIVQYRVNTNMCFGIMDTK